VVALVAAARVAPSADNFQPWRFVAVRTPRTRRRLAAAVPRAVARSVEHAPVVLVACGVQTLISRVRTEQPFAMIDVPIAVTHVLLEAREIGLACAWTLEVDEPIVREVLQVPESVRVVAVLALGWPR
jgi:nitroreductase